MSGDSQNNAATSAGDDSLGGFFSNILTPGSSLNPVFLRIVDGVLASLTLIFLALLILSHGSIHFVFLIVINGCLWASVKWFVAELQNVRTQEATHNGETKPPGSKPKDK